MLDLLTAYSSPVSLFLTLYMEPKDPFPTGAMSQKSMLTLAVEMVGKLEECGKALEDTTERGGVHGVRGQLTQLGLKKLPNIES